MKWFAGQKNKNYGIWSKGIKGHLKDYRFTLDAIIIILFPSLVLHHFVLFVHTSAYFQSNDFFYYSSR